jgi:hypothetical protein
MKSPSDKTLRIAPLGNVIDIVGKHPSSFVEREEELPPIPKVGDHVDGRQWHEDAVMNLVEKNDRDAKLEGSPQFGVIAGIGTGAIRVVEEAAFNLTVGIGARW